MTVADMSTMEPPRWTVGASPAETVRASDRVNRALAIAVGAGGLGYALLAVPEIVYQSKSFAVWWIAAATAGLAGSCLGLAVFALRARREPRGWLAAVAVSPVLACATYPFASAFGALEGQSLWILRVVPLAVLAATMLSTPLRTALFILFSGAMAATANCHAIGDWAVAEFAQYFVRNVSYASVFAWAIGSAKRAAVLLDDASERDARAAARVAANLGRSRERDRFAALIHDGVLSTLLDASRGQESGGLARQAVRTLAELDAFRSESGGDHRLGADAGIRRLHTAVHDAARSVRFSATRAAGSDTFAIPESALDVLAAALVEAVRNSVRHAGGDDVRRSVDVTVTASGISARVTDEGSGFDHTGVPANRLGVPVSILGRMRALPGGSASVESRPGAGTMVTVAWEHTT